MTKKAVAIIILAISIPSVYFGFMPSRGSCRQLSELPEFVPKNEIFLSLPTLGGIRWIRKGRLGAILIFGEIDLDAYLNQNLPMFETKSDWAIFVDRSEAVKFSWPNAQNETTEISFAHAQNFRDKEKGLACNLYISEKGQFVASILQD